MIKTCQHSGVFPVSDSDGSDFTKADRHKKHSMSFQGETKNYQKNLLRSASIFS